MMAVTTVGGNPFKTKKALREHIGKHLCFVETSMFGAEFKGAGKYTIVGPEPYKRVWYAQVTVKDDGELMKVS